MTHFQLPFNAKCAAIFHYKETLHPNDGKTEAIAQGNKLLAQGKYDKAIAHVNLALDNLTPHVLAGLDIRLRAHMTRQQYKEALEDAVEMERRVPESYFGYVRAVQILMMRGRVKSAFEELKKGFDNLKRQEDIDALAKYVRVLDIAAADFGLMNKFDDAHELARMIVTLVPQSAMGYLRAGTVFLLQGKADRALEVYTAGIAKVSDKQQLISRKEYVLRKSKSIDHITRAPFDVLGWILQHLDSHDLFTCLNVCYDWRVRFQQYPRPWHKVYICDHSNMSLLEQARSYIQTMYIANTDVCMVYSCLKLVASGAFPNLVELDIDIENHLRLDKCMTRYHSKDFQQHIKLGKALLMHFENLKPVLEQMSVPICLHFDDLLDRDPHETQSITLACPTLSELALNAMIFQNAPDPKNQTEAQKSCSYYSLTTDIVDARHKYDEGWTNLPDITSTTITKFSFSFKGEAKSKQWIGWCPALKDLTLKDMRSMDGSIFYAIKRLPKLHRLEIRSCESINRSRFESFFHMLAYKRDQVQLHTLVINDFNAALSDSLHAVSRYRYLRSLTLINCNSLVGMAIGSFAGHLRAMDSLLEELVLVQIEAVTDATLIQVVNDIPRLQRFGLEQLDNITDDGIIQIVNGSAHTLLSSLSIYNCSQITDRGVSYAKRRLSVKMESSIVSNESDH